MSWIQIPEGKTEVRLADGSWTKIPEGMKEVDSSKLWQEVAMDAQDDIQSNVLSTPIPKPKEVLPTNIDYRGGTVPTTEQGTAITPESQAMGDQLLGPLSGGPRGVTGAVEEVVGLTGAEAAMDIANASMNSLASDDFLKNNPYYMKDAIELASGLAGGIATFKLGSGTMNMLLDKLNYSKLPTNVANIAKVGGISESEAATLLSNVPKDQWAKVLAQHGGADTSGLLTSGIVWDATEKGKANYAREVTARVNAVKESVAGKSFDEFIDVVELEYNSMKKVVKDASLNPNAEFDANTIQSTLEQMSKEIGTDTVVGRLKKTAQNLAEEKNGYSIGDLIDLKQEANWEWKKASPQDRKKIEAFKKSIDDFIQDNTDSPEILKLIEDSTDSYHKLKTTQRALEIIDSATVVRSAGSDKGTHKATNWNKAYEDLNEEFKHLKNNGNIEEYKALKNAFTLTKKFQKKFGSSEAELFGVTKTAGETGNIGADKLVGVTPMAAISRGGTNALLRWIYTNIPFTDSGKRLRMERAIAKSIDKSSSQDEFVRTLIKNENIPQEVADRLTENVINAQNVVNIRKMNILSGKDKVTTFGVKGSDRPTYPKQGEEVGGLDRLRGTKVEPEVEAVKAKSALDRLGIGLNEGTQVGGLNRIPETTKTPTPDKQFKPTDGRLGMTSQYGGKATGTNGVNTSEAKANLNRFMDDIANPKVSVDTNKVSELFDMLKAEGTTMYGATQAKEKAWNKAMDIVNQVKNMKTVSPKVREQMIKAMKEYYDLLDDTI